MLDVIEKLLVLQDRDRKLRRVKTELATIEPQRQAMKNKGLGAQTGLDRAKQHTMEIETKRKQLDLEIETKKGQIEKYGHQQLQTRKNDEYQALTHEIAHCKEAISKIEDQQLDLMEKAEVAAREMAAAAKVLKDAQGVVENEIKLLTEREENLKKELAELSSNRQTLAGAVDESILNRYERIMNTRGDNVVVDIARGICGGCHMKIPPQVVMSCRAQQEITTCTNCGRILYYQPGMELAAAD